MFIAGRNAPDDPASAGAGTAAEAVSWRVSSGVRTTRHRIRSRSPGTAASAAATILSAASSAIRAHVCPPAGSAGTVAVSVMVSWSSSGRSSGSSGRITTTVGRGPVRPELTASHSAAGSGACTTVRCTVPAGRAPRSARWTVSRPVPVRSRPSGRSPGPAHVTTRFSNSDGTGAPETTMSASTGPPRSSSRPAARPSFSSTPVTAAPKTNSTFRARQRSYTASARARRPPFTYQEPKVCSMYGSTAADGGALRGSRPYATAWLSSSAARRGSRSSRVPISARVRAGRRNRPCRNAG